MILWFVVLFRTCFGSSSGKKSNVIVTICKMTPKGVKFNLKNLLSISCGNGLFHFLSVQGDGRKIPGLVKSMNFQRSTAKSPKIPGRWQQFATKCIEIKIFILTDFSRLTVAGNKNSRAGKEKNIFQGARLENCTSTKSLRHSRTLVVHPLTFSGGFSEGKTCQGSFSRHYYSDHRKFHPIFQKNFTSIGICWGQSSQRC